MNLLLERPLGGEQKEEIIVLGMNLTNLKAFQIFCICVFFLNFFYIIMAIMQEYIFKVYKFQNASFVAFTHLFFYFLFSTFQMMKNGGCSQFIKEEKAKKRREEGKRDDDDRVSAFRQKKGRYFYIIWLMILLSFLRGLGKILAFEVLLYVSYPTKVLFKEGKMITTMIIGTLWLSRKYSFLDYLASLFLVFGLFSVYTANKKIDVVVVDSSSSSSSSNIIGYVLMLVSILPDSFAGNLQEKLLMDEGESIPRVVFFSHAVGSFLGFLFCLMKGEFFSSFVVIFESPFLGALIFFQVFFAFLGFQFLLTITKRNGVIITQTVCSVRKCLSVFLSFLLFPKQIHLYHGFGIFLVFFGVFLRVIAKYKKNLEKKKIGGPGNEV